MFCLNLCVDIYHELAGESIKSEEVIEVSFPYHKMVGVEVLAADKPVCLFITFWFYLLSA